MCRPTKETNTGTPYLSYFKISAQLSWKAYKFVFRILSTYMIVMSLSGESFMKTLGQYSFGKKGQSKKY